MKILTYAKLDSVRKIFQLHATTTKRNNELNKSQLCANQKKIWISFEHHRISQKNDCYCN